MPPTDPAKPRPRAATTWNGNPLDVSIREIAARIRAKEITSKAVVLACLDQIRRVNGKLNAVVAMDEEKALLAAQLADDKIAAGAVMGPLHGVPMTIKDSFDSAGLVTTYGSKGRAKHVPTADAAVLALLRNAGAILVGKTNTPELCMLPETRNEVYGVTNNPYDLGRTPAGSSGGAAAIVAAVGVYFDIGSDVGGSIRQPSHACGVVGLKPTEHRVPLAGHLTGGSWGALDSAHTAGPICRRVDDLEYVFDVLAAPDASAAPPPRRVAFFTDNGVIAALPEVAAAVRSAADALKREGMIVQEKRPPAIGKGLDLWFRLMSSDGGRGFRQSLERWGTTEPSPLVESSLELLATAAKNSPGLSSLRREWEAFRRDMDSFLQDFDVVLSPVHPSPAMKHLDMLTTDVGSLGMSYTMCFNLCGWPALSVPTTQTSTGLPLGVQLAGPRGSDRQLIRVARLIEQALGGWKRPSVAS